LGFFTLTQCFDGVAAPKDPSGPTAKGTFGMTYVKEAGKWLVALDSWNLDMPPSPAKSQ
jgi:hypothetical protein